MEFPAEPRVHAILDKIGILTPEAYLVGGAVRDLLMGNAKAVDLDLAVAGDGYALAREVVRQMGAGVSFVPLDRERGTARLVLDRGLGPTIDVSSFKGPTIIEDLLRRDFTINAMALPIAAFRRGDTSAVHDPLGGQDDLRSGIIRACSRESLEDDPLRVLRAFRFQATLGFRIDPDSLAYFLLLADALLGVSGERVRDELMAILHTGRAPAALAGMVSAGIFKALFPELEPTFACEQNSFHHLNVWDHTVETVRQIGLLAERKFGCLGEFGEQIDRYLAEEQVRGRSNRSLVNLAAVFHDAGKPQVKSVDPDGRIRFFGHEKLSGRLFAAAGERLRLSNRELRRVGSLVEGHMRPFVLLKQELSRKALYRLCRHFEEDMPGLLLLFLGDLGASRGPDRKPETFPQAIEKACRVWKLWDEWKSAPPEPLLRGDDIMGMFGLEPGPFLGTLLKRVNELHACGEVRTREEGFLAVKRLLENGRDRS
ncbi:MAG: HD domain-containing protein [Thermodesulfobacteriota bacterium]